MLRSYLTVVEQPDIYLIFGRRIAAERAARGISQQDLGDRIGLSRASIANIEAGRQRVLLHQAIDLAHALDVQSVSDLLPLDVLRPDDFRGGAKDLILTGSSVSRHEANAIAKIVASS